MGQPGRQSPRPPQRPGAAKPAPAIPIDAPDYVRNPDNYEKASFVIPTQDGPVAFDAVFPKEGYDGMALFEQFEKHFGPKPGDARPEAPKPVQGWRGKPRR